MLLTTIMIQMMCSPISKCYVLRMRGIQARGTVHLKSCWRATAVGHCPWGVLLRPFMKLASAFESNLFKMWSGCHQTIERLNSSAMMISRQ